MDDEPGCTGPADPGTPEETGYGRRHPWHYYAKGDNAPPVPFEAIPPCESSGKALADDFPKAPAKRMTKVRALLEEERSELAKTGLCYQEVVDRGADALSEYDRTIAYGGNLELARASTIALLYGQISWRRGRIALLERENARGGGRAR